MIRKTALDGKLGPALRRRTVLIGAVAAALGAVMPFGRGRAQAAQARQPDPVRVPTPGRMIHGGNPPEYPSQGPLHVKLHINQLKGAWGWTSAGEAGKDENGYPIAIGSGPNPRSRILHSQPLTAGIGPYSGAFRLYGRGTGQFKIGWHDQRATARLPRVVRDGREYWYADFRYDPRQRQGALSLEIVALPVPGDHIRDLALVHASHIANWERGEIFMPEAIADLRLFGQVQAERRRALGRSGVSERGALRVMQMVHANEVWNGTEGFRKMGPFRRDRRFVGPDFYSFVRIQNSDAKSWVDKIVPTALPIEHAVALCNETGCDLWYNLAPDILDSRAQALGAYVRDHLDPALTVYWEYGNELWNSARGFDGYQYAKAWGEATFPGLRGPDAVYEWDVYRSMQLYALLRDVFAETGRTARYMAAFAAWAASNRPDGEDNAGSYAAKYFRAEHARKRQDLPEVPENIITDMSVGGYFAAPNGRAAQWLEAAYDDNRARARAYARFVQFGMAGDLIEIGPKHLEAPLTDVATDAEISVVRLIARDVQAGGFDAWTDLPRVFRIEGRDLQYRGVNAAAWTTVMSFATSPGRDFPTLVRDVQVMGLGNFKRGTSGHGSQLRTTIAQRVEAHRHFAAQRGLRFHFYEGGPGSDGAPGSDPQITAGWMRVFHTEGWAAEVLSNFLSLVDDRVDQMVWYKTHNRYNRDNWGLKAYYGQPGAAAPKWQAVERDILQDL